MGLLDHHPQSGNICPRCAEKGRRGYLVVKRGSYGAFLGCDQYPKCYYSEKLGVNLETEATKLLKAKRKKTRRGKKKSNRAQIEAKIAREQRKQRGRMFSDFERLIAE